MSLDFDTARDSVLGICRSLARHRARRFYVVNIGISTIRPLRMAVVLLATEGALRHSTDFTAARPIRSRMHREQGKGRHADLVETSSMRYIAPEVVDMRLAVRDLHPERENVSGNSGGNSGGDSGGGLTRDPNGIGTCSPSGIWGDPRAAMRERGEVLVGALFEGICDDLRVLRCTPLPQAKQPAGA